MPDQPGPEPGVRRDMRPASGMEWDAEGVVYDIPAWRAALLLIFQNAVDAVSKALNIVEYSHHEAHEGKFFFVKDWADLDGAGTKAEFLFRVPAGVVPHAQWSIAGEAEFTMELFRGVTVSADGTPITPVNANGNSDNAAVVQAFSGPTVTDDGTKIWAGKIGSGRNATVGRDTGYEYMGKLSTDYLFRITKVASGTHWLDYDFNWYEKDA